MQNFKIGKRISDGAFGTVYQAKLITNSKSNKYPEIVAIKQVYTSSQNLKRQLRILKKLPKHPNIVQVYDSFQQNYLTSIVMQRGMYDLTYFINENYYPISEDKIKNIAIQILEGIKAVHSAGIVHRDLKPSNLIIRENGSIALCDFGSAVQSTTGQQYQLEGFTRWYKCPEMLFGDRQYKFEADIWSVGCILIEIATGEPLFNGKSQIQQLALMTQFLGDPSPVNWPSVTKMPDFNKITFKTIKPKTIEEISEEWEISLQLSRFISKMIRYEKRLCAQDLLKDEYLLNVKRDEKIVMDGIDLRMKHKNLLQLAHKNKIIDG